jgi:hypothetical protein
MDAKVGAGLRHPCLCAGHFDNLVDPVPPEAMILTQTGHSAVLRLAPLAVVSNKNCEMLFARG